MLYVTSLKSKCLNRENKMEYYCCQRDEGKQSLLDVVIIKQSPKGEYYLNWSERIKILVIYPWNMYCRDIGKI